MKQPRPWIVILCLAGLFALGASTGAVVHSTYTRAAVLPRATSGAWAEQELEEYRQRLDLTAEQVAAFRPLFTETSEKLKTLHTETRGRIIALLRENNAQLAPQLTSDQSERLRAMLRARQTPTP